MNSPEARAAFINAAVARAMITAMGMQADNDQCKYEGKPMAWTKIDFDQIPEREGICHNPIVELLRD